MFQLSPTPHDGYVLRLFSTFRSSPSSRPSLSTMSPRGVPPPPSCATRRTLGPHGAPCPSNDNKHCPAAMQGNHRAEDRLRTKGQRGLHRRYRTYTWSPDTIAAPAVDVNCLLRVELCSAHAFSTLSAHPLSSVEWSVAEFRLRELSACSRLYNSDTDRTSVCPGAHPVGGWYVWGGGQREQRGEALSPRDRGHWKIRQNRECMFGPEYAQSAGPNARGC